jgi:flagellar basal-body rod protein FlgB
MSLFDKTTQALQAATQMRQLRHNITSSNIANAETPGYHAKKIDFEDSLARALNNAEIKTAATGRQSLDVTPDIYENPEGRPSNTGNTVDLEREMAALAENTMMYRAAVQLINKKLGSLKYAITEGR